MKLESFMIATLTAASSYSLIGGYKLPLLDVEISALECSYSTQFEECAQQATFEASLELDTLGPFATPNQRCLILEDLFLDIFACAAQCDESNCEVDAPFFLEVLAIEGCPVTSVEEFCAEVNSSSMSFVSPILVSVGISLVGFFIQS